MKKELEPVDLYQHLCFPIYAASNKLMRRYNKFLKYLGLTYTQYIVMATLWKKENITQKELGETLWLKSNTLTPLLQKLMMKGYINVDKSKDDKRCVNISLTDSGKELKQKAINVPRNIVKRVELTEEEKQWFVHILYKILDERE